MNVATFYSSRVKKLWFPWGAAAHQMSRVRGGLRLWHPLHPAGLRPPNALHLGAALPNLCTWGLRPQTTALAWLLDGNFVIFQYSLVINHEYSMVISHISAQKLYELYKLI